MADDIKEELIEVIGDIGTDDMRDIMSRVIKHIADTRKLKGGQHLYTGVKVPIDPKAQKAMAHSFADAFMEWAVNA